MGENTSEECDRFVAPAEEELTPPIPEELDEGQDDEQEEEVEPFRKAASPTLPSAADIEEHRINHTPCRSLCTGCNMGRGLGDQRGSHVGRAHEVPIVGVDFWYITTGGVKRRDELQANDDEVRVGREDGKITKCMVVRCYATKSVFAHVFITPQINSFILSIWSSRSLLPRHAVLLHIPSSTGLSSCFSTQSRTIKRVGLLLIQ